MKSAPKLYRRSSGSSHRTTARPPFSRPIHCWAALTPKCGAGETRQRDTTGHNRAYSGHIPGIFRVRNNHRVLYCPSPVTAWGMVVACRMARCRSRRGEWSSCAVWPGRRSPREGWSSRAVSPVAGHGVENSRRVPYRPSPDRVPSRPSLPHVSSYPGPCRRPHVSAVFPVGRAARPSSAMFRPNMAREQTPPPAVYEHLFLCMAVAFCRGTFGGAAKRHRWAALTPTHRP